MKMYHFEKLDVTLNQSAQMYFEIGMSVFPRDTKTMGASSRLVIHDSN